MKKSTLFISAALTAFVLVVLGTVAATFYKPVVSDNQTAAVATEAPVDPATETPVATQAVSVSPQQAADIAAQAMNATDLYSVEGTNYNGVNAYLVTFSSGATVVVGSDGQVLLVTMAQATTVSAPVQGASLPAAQPSSNNKGNNHSGGEREHEDDDD
jgi:hypothetical protein